MAFKPVAPGQVTEAELGGVVPENMAVYKVPGSASSTSLPMTATGKVKKAGTRPGCCA